MFGLLAAWCGIQSLLSYHITNSSHLWALELITGDTIFNIERTADVHLARIKQLLGPFPPQFLEACTRRAEHFDPSG